MNKVVVLLSIWIFCFLVLLDMNESIVLGFVDFSDFTKEGKNRNKCNIVVYDTIRGFLNWHQDFFLKVAKELNIEIKEAYRDSQIKGNEADVVIFHAKSHTHIDKNNLKKKYKNALFAMVTMEQPLYAPVLQQFDYLKRNFDFTVTYSLQSVYPGTSLPNLPITYFPTHIIPLEKVMERGLSFREKTGYDTGVEVVLFTSNCKAAGATERYKYLEELMKHITVHSYGKCLKNRNEPSMPDDPTWPVFAQRRARKIKVLSQYKFYLAFENAPVNDYVSEKVFEGLLAGTISVYRGAKQIQSFMPSNHSFIDANHLSPKQLAETLTAIGKDEKLYNSYFQFKEQPLSASFRKIGEMSYTHPNVAKRICDYALQAKQSQ